MKLFSAAQVKQWDAYTIANEPVSSLDLMERAATACFNWLQQQYPSKQLYYIFCGPGNNGGDGLAIARMLVQQKHTVFVYLLNSDKENSGDFTANLKKLETCTFNIKKIAGQNDFPLIPDGCIVIDALFGTGLNKPLMEIPAALVNHINESNVPVISIDVPSGLFADSSSEGNTIIKASYTLSFRQYKLAFLVAQNAVYSGAVVILDIGLHKNFYNVEEPEMNITDTSLIKSFYKPRADFSHKGTYGHAALINGSYGMMGAAVLCAKGCLKSGTGKLTCFIPECGYTVLQSAIPEAMCITNGEKYIETISDLEKYNAVGIGPGIGNYSTVRNVLQSLFQLYKKPVVLDADALNVLAENKILLEQIPPGSILTPHQKEFERLFGESKNDFERLQSALQKSKAYNILIVLKGHYSFIATPEGKGYFNTTGNAGMATAGSGDVLTGIITGLLAQSYTPLEAALLGVYIHGAAGDAAAAKLSKEAMLASDIAGFIGEVFLNLQQ